VTVSRVMALVGLKISLYIDDALRSFEKAFV